MFDGCPVKVWQDAEEFEWLYEKVSSLKPRTILEIGSYKGGTVWNWIKSDPKLIVSVEKTPLTLELQKLWASWVEGTQTEIRFIRGESQDGRVVNKVRSIIKECDFLFIDGDHRSHKVQHDWLSYWPMVRKGGFAAFHDIVPWQGSTVHEVWSEIKASGLRTEEITLHKDILGTGIVWKD